MVDLNIIDTSNMDLVFPLNKKIDFDPKSENIHDYLLKCKTEFDHSRPNSIKLLGACLIFICILISLLILYFNLEELTILSDESFSDPNVIGSIITVSLLLIYLVVIIAPSMIGLYIFYIFYFTQKDWSDDHSRLASLTGRLKANGTLDNHFLLDEDSQGYRLKQISINWNIHWIFPFLFKTYPPLILEVMALSILVSFFFFSVIIVSILILISIESFIIIIVAYTIVSLFCLFVSILILNSLHRPLKHYTEIRLKMKNTQEDKNHQLLLEGEENTKILINQSNLNRLNAVSRIPIPFIWQISSLFAILSSALGVLSYLF